jgi:hypothetical protein
LLGWGFPSLETNPELFALSRSLLNVYDDRLEIMKPSATHKWLLAAVTAVTWAIATTILWMLLAFAFGRSKSDFRLITVLIVGAAVAAVLAAYGYSEGWKAGSKAALGGRREPDR